MIGQPEALAGRTAVVTGGASGIGARTVEVLRALGARVVAVDKSFGPAEGGDAEHCDLGDVAEIRACADRIGRRTGHIDILVNCAGIVGPEASVADIAEDAWDLVQAVNLKAVVFMSQAVIPYMTGGGARGGNIVNVSSASAHRATARSVAYASSKAAVESVTRVLAGELAPHGVNVNAVAPGVTATAIFGEAQDSDEDRARRASQGATGNLFNRFAQPDDIAQVIAFLCLPESRQITAQTVHASAGSIV
ncbi:SDR family oxidoreductase [Streptomyces sp. NPDC047002]|uniref:SDR family NAD(P)-dependent oxidoreductase n=1 Tax=Streptomyces sp. NPDC047002 TaxID=3155475 RepID=UPI003456091E